MVFVDSCVWIAFKNENDYWHSLAKELVPSLLKSGEEIRITAFVLLETINFLTLKVDPSIAKITLSEFLESDIEIIDTSKADLEAAGKYLTKNLSLTDAHIAACMKRFGEKVLYSFDSDFDEFKFIKRLEKFEVV